MYISFSGFSTHEGCGLEYWHGYVNKTKPLDPDNKANSLYGSVVGALFQEFYDQKLWSNPKTVKSVLVERAASVLDRIIYKETKKGNVVDFSKKPSTYQSKEDLLEAIVEAIPTGLRIIKTHRLLSHDVGTEVVLDQTLRGHKVAGRADFVLTLEQNKTTILDGKGSLYRDRYSKPLQLYWYAMLFREIRGVLPDQIGFLYWRFEPDKALDWIELSESRVDTLRQDVLDTADRIDLNQRRLDVLSGDEKISLRDELFFATPGKNCKFCRYLSICDTGTNYQRGSDTPFVLGTEEIIGL